MPALQDFPAEFDVFAGRADVFSRARQVIDDHTVIAVLAAFLHHHRIGTVRHRGAGEDAGGGARLQGHAHRAGRDALADRQADAGSGDVGGTHGIAVHRRVGEWRHGYGQLLRKGQNAAGGRGQRQQADFFDRLRGGQQFFQGLFETQHARSCKFNWRWFNTKSAMAPTSFSGSLGKSVAMSASLATATMSLRSGNSGGLPFSGR